MPEETALAVEQNAEENANKLTRKEQKEAKEAARRIILDNNPDLKSDGLKLDRNNKIVDSPKLAVAANIKPTFTPLDLKKKDQGTVEKGATSFGEFYQRTTLVNGDEKERIKTYRGGKKTKVETFTAEKVEMADDGKPTYKRTGKKVEKGNSSREVAYHDGGSKTVTKTGFFGTKTTRITPKGNLPDDAGAVDKFMHLFSRPKKETLHVKRFGYEKRYVMVGDDKVLVAKKYGPFSQYTKINEDGSKLIKTKYLGGLVSKTVKITGKGDEAETEVVAKRNFFKRVNTYTKDDGTKDTVERLKGLKKKTIKEEFVTDETSGKDGIKVTVTTSRFGGKFNSTTTNVRPLNEDEQRQLAEKTKFLAGKELPALHEEAMKATRAMREGLIAFQKNPKDEAAREKLSELTDATVVASENYRSKQEKAGTKVSLDETIRSFGDKERKEEILNGTTEDKVIGALKNSAKSILKSEAALAEKNTNLGLIVTNEGNYGKVLNAVGQPSQQYSRAKNAVDEQTAAHQLEMDKFDKAARSYVEYMNIKYPDKDPLELKSTKIEFLDDQRVSAREEIEKAKSLQLASSERKAEEKKLLESAAGTEDKKPTIEAFAAQVASSARLLEHAVTSRGLDMRVQERGRA